LKVKYDPEFTLFTIIKGEFGNIMIAGSSSDINYDADMKMLSGNAVKTKILMLPAKMNESRIFGKWFEVINPEITISASHNKIPEQDLAKIMSGSRSFYDTQTTGAVSYTYSYDSKQEAVETFK